MDYFSYKDTVYHAEDVAIPKIADAVDTPFYCYSSATIERHYKVFSSAFGDMDAKICFAVKANDNLAVLATMAKMGAWADVVSAGEIRRAMKAGIKADNIVFSGVGKTREEMFYALEQGIYQFNVESEPELRLLNEVALEIGKKAPVAMRINPDVDPKTHAKISTGQKESKFGVAMSHAHDIYRLADSLAGIVIQGVSIHIGSQLTTLEPFAQAFSKVREFITELKEDGIALKTLDLGGGLGIPYGKEQPPLPEFYADIVKENTKGLNLRLLFEPGRIMVGNAGILVTKVLYVKRGENRIYVIVDAAMNDLMRPALYDAYHEIVPIVPSTGETRTEMVDVVGPVCETSDIFAEQRLMKIPKVGDLLAFRSAGAYGASMAGTYNSRPLVAEIMVKGENFSVIRPRQTYDELIGRDMLPEWLERK
ncbi:MAG: diaminopimelate decarboxylase [Rickettsiales bacterium]